MSDDRIAIEIRRHLAIVASSLPRSLRKKALEKVKELKELQWARGE